MIGRMFDTGSGLIGAGQRMGRDDHEGSRIGGTYGATRSTFSVDVAASLRRRVEVLAHTL